MFVTVQYNVFAVLLVQAQSIRVSGQAGSWLVDDLLIELFRFAPRDASTQVACSDGRFDTTLQIEHSLADRQLFCLCHESARRFSLTSVAFLSCDPEINASICTSWPWRLVGQT